MTTEEVYPEYTDRLVEKTYSTHFSGMTVSHKECSSVNCKPLSQLVGGNLWVTTEEVDKQVYTDRLVEKTYSIHFRGMAVSHKECSFL